MGLQFLKNFPELLNWCFLTRHCHEYEIKINSFPHFSCLPYEMTEGCRLGKHPIYLQTESANIQSNGALDTDGLYNDNKTRTKTMNWILLRNSLWIGMWSVDLQGPFL